MNIKYHILAASFFVSCVLWLSLSLNLNYEIEKKVPVKVNVDKPFAIANYIPPVLDVKLKGKGWTLLKLFTSVNLNFNYDINASSNEQVVILTKQHINDYDILGENLTVTYIKPESLYVKIERAEEKYVRLVPRISVDCREGYQTVGNPVVDPDSIKIEGAPSIVRTLNYLPTEFQKFSNVNSNISENIKLSDTLSNIIWKNQEDVFLKVLIELTAEKDVRDIEIRVTDLPLDRDVLLIPQYINLHVRGGVNQLAGLDRSKISAVIDFKQLLTDTTGSVTPSFTLPSGVILLTYSPDRIQYVIKKKY